MITFSITIPVIAGLSPGGILQEVAGWVGDRKQTTLRPVFKQTETCQEFTSDTEKLVLLQTDETEAARLTREEDDITWTTGIVYDRQRNRMTLQIDQASRSGTEHPVTGCPALLFRLAQKHMLVSSETGTIFGVPMCWKGDLSSLIQKKRERPVLIFPDTFKPQGILEIAIEADCLINGPDMQQVPEPVQEGKIACIFPDDPVIYIADPCQYAKMGGTLAVITMALRAWYLRRPVSVKDTFAGVLRIKAEKEAADTISRLEKENGALQTDKQNLKERLQQKLSSTEEKTPLLLYGQEKDEFPGEIRDFVLECVADALKNAEKDTRRYHVLSDLLQANPYDHQHESMREKVKQLLKGQSRMSEPIMQGLAECGLITQKGKTHIRIRFPNDERYLVMTSTTGSDFRGGDNTAHKIIRYML